MIGSTPETPWACAAQPVQIRCAIRVKSDRQNLRRALFGDVNMVRRIRAAHVELVGRPVGSDEAEIGQEFFRLIEVGRAQPHPGEIADLDDRLDQDVLPKFLGGRARRFRRPRPA
ncbi:MAG: hypothetical protein WDO24_19285 [Pseudomonadota bacterium]